MRHFVNMNESFKMVLKSFRHMYITNPFTEVNGNFGSTVISLLPSALADGLVKLLNKLALATFLIVALFTLTSFQITEIAKGEKEFPEVIYPKIRIWTTPSKGEEPAFNSPGFQWPSTKKATYSFRLSSSKDFGKILIDGEGQPFSDGAYGWIPRFLHGKQISYAVGDASSAYSGQEDGKNVDFGMKSFRRHYILLRPSTIVIYDELEADHNAEWSWLLHNDNGFEIDPAKNTIFAESEKAKAKVSLFSSSAIDFQVTDQFSVPVDNWTNKVDEEGDTIVFANQWHFKGVSKEKTKKMRYLAIFQVKPDGSFEEVKQNGEGTYKVGSWNISAQMNTLKPVNIQVWNNVNTEMLVSGGILNFDGKIFSGNDRTSAKLVEMKNGKVVFQEAMDEIPSVIKTVMQREK